MDKIENLYVKRKHGFEPLPDDHCDFIESSIEDEIYKDLELGKIPRTKMFWVPLLERLEMYETMEKYFPNDYEQITGERKKETA